MGDTFIPLQFALLYDGLQVFMWSDCQLDPGTDFLIGIVEELHFQPCILLAAVSFVILCGIVDDCLTEVR